MKSTLPILTLFLILSFGNCLSAQTISVDFAKKIAQNHLASVGGNSLKSAGPDKVKTQFTSYSVTSTRKDTLYFVLNDTINHTFVIIAADRRSTPIIGYSLDGNYSSNNQPPAFVEWMENRKKELEYIKDNNIKAASKINEQWEKLSQASSNESTGMTSIEPLIKTQWDQGCFYNELCPSDPKSTYCGHVPTGCTITAMAQIMKYWNYPTRGIGSHSYLCAGYGLLSADFGATTYQWNQMPNIVTSKNDVVATLMYHLGVSLDTEYGAGSSGSWDPRDELIKYFNYSSNAMLINKSGFKNSEWINLLKSELDLRRPIWYMGSSAIGHSFVCDGYQNPDYFHFNWGWSGTWNGYFYIGNLNPSGYDFNANQTALINLVPGDLPDGYQGLFLSSNASYISTKGGTATVDICSSINWTASSDQSWLSISSNSGNIGKTTLTLTAPENQTGSDRSALITISAEGYFNQTIKVSQPSIINVTPGGLYNLISSNATTITTLNLSGTIDARDFKTMRDAMPALTEVDLSDVKIIAYTGFEGTTIESRAFPANEIPIDAFKIIPCQGENHIKSVVLSTNITSIGTSAFSNSKYLSIINIPASVTNICEQAFEMCTASITVDINNPNYSSSEGVLYNKNKTTLIQCPISKKGLYQVPSTVTCIERFAFSNVNELTTITIPSSVTSIEDLALNKCSALLNVDFNNQKYSSVDGVLFNKDRTELLRCPTSKTGNYIIPSTVILIGSFAFDSCIGLTEVTIPSSVVLIGKGAFSYCSSLTSIIIPSSVTAINYSAFNYCKNLQSIHIPFSVIAVESCFLSGCVSLNSIYTYSITPINLLNAYEAFIQVNKTTCTLYVPFGSKTLYSSADKWQDFQHIEEMKGLFLSKNKIDMGFSGGKSEITISSSSRWSALSDQPWLEINPSESTSGRDIITITGTPNPTNSIRQATIIISGPDIESQTITVTQYSKVEVTAGNLKTIFAGHLSNITSLTLTGTIDARDFKTMRDEMPALIDIDLSEITITAYIGTEGTDGTEVKEYLANCVPNFAFYNTNLGHGKTTLSSIILPTTITSIGYFAFCDCRSLININIPPMVASIENHAFMSCNNITSIKIPSSVTSIELGAFHLFNGMISVDNNNKYFSSIDGVLFNKNKTILVQCPISKTGEYQIPPSVRTIQIAAFYCCRLTTIKIPSGINFIEKQAFLCSDKLNSIFALSLLPVDLNFCPEVFYGINKDSCKLYVPHGSKEYYKAANQWKDFINIVELPNQAPVAKAGLDRTVYERKLITLDGSASSDPENKQLTYLWTAPAGITLDSNTSAKPTFTAPEVTTDTDYTFSLEVNDGFLKSTADQVAITVKNVDKAPYLKNPVSNISVDKRAPDQIIDLKSVFIDDDASDILTYKITSNSNSAIVSPQISGTNLILSFSPEHTGSTTIEIVAESNGKMVSTKFTVEVKIPTGLKTIPGKQQITIWPNPTNGMINVVIDQNYESDIKLIIMDSRGIVVLLQNIRKEENQIDLSGLPRGQYLVKTSANVANAQKIILK